jgi:hypothetical protein
LVLALLGYTLTQVGSARAGFVYQVTVNTSSLQGSGGYLDFQLNPADSTAKAATATIQSYLQTGGGALAPTSVNTGDAFGTLPATLTLDNGTAFNDIFQGVTFGSQFSFQLTLSGDAFDHPGGTKGSSFALSLYSSDGITPLLTTDPNGSVLTINVNPNGTTQVLTFPQDSSSGSPPAAGANPVNAVPAPPSLLLLLCASPAGLVAWLRSCKRRNRHRAQACRHER